MAKNRLENYDEYLDTYNKEIDTHVVKGMTYEERKLKNKKADWTKWL